VRFLLVGLIVPHAPVLLPEVRGDGATDSRLPPREEGAPLCVLVSPHGSNTGVYRRVRGDLDGFGIRDIDVERRTDRAFGKELARAWNRPLLEEDLDHGASVPLRIAVPGGLSVVAATFREITGPNGGSLAEVRADAEAFAAAVLELAEGRDLIVAASAHTSAALSPAAPLTEKPEGHELEERVTKALEEDLGLLTEIDDELWIGSGACGAGPLTAFGHLFRGRTATPTFREAPFGVGYLLAQTA
jgi:hypothetical protein